MKRLAAFSAFLFLMVSGLSSCASMARGSYTAVCEQQCMEGYITLQDQMSCKQACPTP
jgi:hypothetical protein